MNQPIGILGTGLMGSAVASRLAGLGWPVHVYNRTPERAAPLRDSGVTVHDRVAGVFERAPGVMTWLSDWRALESTLLEEAADLGGAHVLQMGTIGPQESRDLATRIQDRGGQYAECPVLGSVPEARDGTLILLFGGASAEAAYWQGPLEALGTHRYSLGDIGQAAANKLALNQLIAGLTSSFAASLGFLRAAGADIEGFMGILRQSALYAPTFDKKLGRIQAERFSDPNFPAQHLLKDVRLMRQEALARGLDTTWLDAEADLLNRTVEQGRGEQDYSALAALLQPQSPPSSTD